MVRKKNSKALFEVLSQGRGVVEVPDWIKKKPEDQAELPPDTELPKDEIPPLSGTQETEVELVEAEEPTTDDVEIVEQEIEPEEFLAPPEIEIDESAAAIVEQPEETPPELEPEDEYPEELVVEEDEDQSAAETTEAELFTTEQDATDDVSDTYDEVNDDGTDEIVEDIEESETTLNEESDEEVLESDNNADAFPRIKRKLPYEVPRDDVSDFSSQQPERLVQMQDERIRISMTRVGAMVALGAVLVLLVAAFAFGLAVGKSRSPEIVEGQQKLPPKAQNLHIAGTRVPQQPVDNDRGVLVDAGNRTGGRYYLVFEKLTGTGDDDRVDASNMMTLFRERGFPAQLVNIAKKGDADRWALWSLHGFENPTSKAARRYVDDIKRVGEEYFRKYSKYEFQNPYFLRKPKK